MTEFLESQLIVHVLEEIELAPDVLMVLELDLLDVGFCKIIRLIRGTGLMSVWDCVRVKSRRETGVDPDVFEAA